MANSNFFGSLFDTQSSDVSLPADLSLPGAKSDTAKTEAPKTETRRPAKSDNWLPSSDLMPIFESSAKAFDVPVNVLMALGHQESRYNPSAVGTPTQWGRAKGIMQYLDDTAKGLGINPFDPAEAIPAAAKQIRDRLNRGESLEDAVKEHFAGPDRKKWGEKTAAYGREVMEKVGKIGSMLGANTGEERAALQQKLDAEAPGRYKVLSDDEAATRFSPDTMDRDAYEHVFRINNPGASQAAIDYALSEYDKNSALRTAAAGNKAAKGFDAMQSPEATFDANLNKRLQGPANGIVPQLPGKMEQPAPVPEQGIPKDESFTDSVKRNAGYVGDNLKIGWNNLLNSFEGMRASEWGGLLDSMKRYYTPEQIAADPKLAKELADREAGYASSMASIAERNKENEELQARGRPETKQFFSASGKPTMEQLATIGDALVKNPVGVISDLGVQSGPQSLAMMAAAILARYTGATPTGAAIAGGGTSAAIQFGSDYADLRAQGMPHDEAWKTAAAKAPVVGAFDALSFNSAGHALDKVLSASGKSGLKEAAKDVGKKAGTVIAETGKQAGYGMAGEAGGSLASGRMPEPTDVIAEGVGEIFGAPGEALSMRTKRPAAPAQETPAAQPQPEATVAPPPAPQSTVTPVPAEQSAASGPMSRAVENAAEQHAEQPPRAEVQTPSGRVAGFVESMQEDGNGGFKFVLQGEDGKSYTYTDKDGVQIAVEQKAPAGPMTAAVEKAAAEQAPSITKGGGIVERTAPPAEAPVDISAMSDAELQKRFDYLAGQHKNASDNKVRTRIAVEKRSIREEILKRQEAVRDEKPVADAVRVRDDSAASAAVSAQEQQGEPAGREAAAQPDRGGQAATGETGAGAGTAVPGANAATDGQSALKDAHAGKWFASQEKADAYLAKKAIGETHAVVQTGNARFEVKPKAGISTTQEPSNSNGSVSETVDSSTKAPTAFDYSTRTDAQLASLAENANTEEKRAAARAEIERRNPSASQPGESNASESVQAQPVESAEPQAAEQPSDVAPRREVRRKRKEAAKAVAAADTKAEAAKPEQSAEEKQKKPTRDEVEAEVTRQLNDQWKAQTGDGFVIGKSYPAKIVVNGNERRLAMFKKKGSGVLYAEALDKTIYGPAFTQYKVTKEGKLEEVGSRNLFGRDKKVAEQAIAEFNAMFNGDVSSEQVKPEAKSEQPQVRRKRKEAAAPVEATEPQADAAKPEPAAEKPAKKEQRKKKSAEAEPVGLSDEQVADFAKRTGNTVENVRRIEEFQRGMGVNDMAAYFEDQVRIKQENEAKAKAEKEELSRLSGTIVIHGDKAYELESISRNKRISDTPWVRPSHEFPTQGIDLWEHYIGHPDSPVVKARLDSARDKTTDNKSSSAETPKAENGLESIFAGLESGKKKTKQQAEAKIAGHPQEAQIRYVEEHWFDILSELEDAGLLKINC